MVGLSSTMGWTISDQQGWRKGPWTPEEDKLLTAYVSLHGEGRWSSVAKYAGLNRSGKSCRLRWVNYLRPGLKRGQITPQEEGIILELHSLWGNKWSTIARYLPGRTDNEIKNYWRTHFKKKEKTSQKIRNRRAQILKQKQLQLQQQWQQQREEPTELSIEMPPTTNIYPTNKMEEQQHYTPYNSNNNNNSIVYRQESNEASWVEEYLGLWSGLWNLEEQQHSQAHLPPPPAQEQPEQGQGKGCGQDQMRDCSKIAMQNQANGFSWGWDPNNALYNNNGGYIF
ncbi:hypothetical protein Ancab_006443 [Ancistrocladus abbreviatus]